MPRTWLAGMLKEQCSSDGIACAAGGGEMGLALPHGTPQAVTWMGRCGLRAPEEVKELTSFELWCC